LQATHVECFLCVCDLTFMAWLIMMWYISRRGALFSSLCIQHLCVHMQNHFFSLFLACAVLLVLSFFCHSNHTLYVKPSFLCRVYYARTKSRRVMWLRNEEEKNVLKFSDSFNDSCDTRGMWLRTQNQTLSLSLRNSSAHFSSIQLFMNCSVNPKRAQWKIIS
jgi:hypothetical protein